MKKHILSLFNQEHKPTTLSLFIASALLIVASQVVGTTDNLPGIVLLLAGMIFFFLIFTHPWKRSKNYVILAGSSLGVIVLIFAGIHLLSWLHMTRYISEAVVMITVFLFALPGVVVGIFGAIFYAGKSK